MSNKIIVAAPVLLSILKQDSKFKSGGYEYINLETKDGFNYDVTSLAKTDDEYFFFGNSDFHNFSRLSLFSAILGVGIRPQHFISDRALVGENVSVGMATVIYPNAVVDGNVKIGFNSMIMPNVSTGAGARIANNTYIGTGVMVGPDAVVGANSYIGDCVRIAKGVKIGKNVIIRDAIHVTEDVADGTIIDSYIGEYVRIFN